MTRHVPHPAWLTTEIEWLRVNWGLYPSIKDIAPFLPRHTPAAITQKAAQMEGMTHHDFHRGRGLVPLLVWWELQKRPGTCDEVADRMGMDRGYIRSIIKLFKRARVVRPARWVKRGTNWCAVWTADDILGVGIPPYHGRRRDQIREILRSNPNNPFAFGDYDADAEHKKDVRPRYKQRAFRSGPRLGGPAYRDVGK